VYSIKFSGLIRIFKKNKSLKKVYKANVKNRFFDYYVCVLALKLEDNPI